MSETCLQGIFSYFHPEITLMAPKTDWEDSTKRVSKIHKSLKLGHTAPQWLTRHHTAFLCKVYMCSSFSIHQTHQVISTVGDLDQGNS